MQKEMTIVEARSRLTQLPEELSAEGAHHTLAITRRGKPVLAMMPYELYDSVIETLEILGDPEMMALLQQGVREADSGQLVKWESAKQKLATKTKR